MNGVNYVSYLLQIAGTEFRIHITSKIDQVNQRNNQVSMTDIEAINQPKQERSRTRWTAPLDKIFADLVVKQIQLGNRPNNVFDKKTWNSIREEFNTLTNLNFNNNQLRKHLDVLRTRFYNLKSTYDQNNDILMDDNCCIPLDMWDHIGFQPRPETIRVKDCPIYEELCSIFTEPAVDGKYAQSSHYEELEKSVGTDAAVLTSSHPENGFTFPENPSSSGPVNASVAENMTVNKNIIEKKKKRQSEIQILPVWNPDTSGTLAGALMEMLNASTLRADLSTPTKNKFSITSCIRALDEIHVIDQQLYFAALDLFEDPNLRETFVSLKNDNIRLAWLQAKCSRSNSTYIGYSN